MSRGVDYLLHAFVSSLDHYRELLGKPTKLEDIAHTPSSSVLKPFCTEPLPCWNTEPNRPR